MNRSLLCLALLGSLGLAAPLGQPAVAQTTSSAVSNVDTLPNGVTFVSSIDRIAPRVAISLVARVGAADETLQTAGWRRLLVNAMLRSAPRGYSTTAPAGTVESTESLARAAERIGGEIGATVGEDTVEIWATGDSEQGPELLRMALALLDSPRLSDADINAARERLRVQSEGTSSDLTSRINDALRAQIFQSLGGEPIAYALPELGNDRSLDYLTNERIRDLHGVLNSARLTVGVAGDIDMAGMRALLEQRGAKSVREGVAPTFAKPDNSAPAFTVRELPVQTAGIFISFPMGAVTSADAPAVRVMVAALADARGARLQKRLLDPSEDEEEQPLTLAAEWVERRYGSELLVSSQTGPQTIEKTKNALIDEVLRLKTAPLTPTELERARVYARGSWSLERQNLRERAYLTALAPALGNMADSSWPQRLQSVTAQDVRRVAQRYLDAYAIALVMPRAS